MVKTGETHSLAQLLEKTFPNEPFLIDDGILNVGSFLIIGGPPKSYKSFLMTTMIYHLCTGSPLFAAHKKSHGRDQPTFKVAKQCRVLLFEQEIGERDMKARLEAMYRMAPPAYQQALRENLFLRSQDHNLQFDTKDGMAAIEAAVIEVKPDVIAFDPFIEFHTSDENSSHAVSVVLRNLDVLREKHQATLLMSHHTGKISLDSGRKGPDLLRGSSVLFGKGDSFLILTPEDRSAGIVHVEMTIRRGAPIKSFYVMLDWGQLRAVFYKWDSPTVRKELITLQTSGSLNSGETEQ